MDTQAIRALLRKSNAPVIRVNEAGFGSFKQPIDAARFQRALSDSSPQPVSLDDITDLASWAAAEVRARLAALSSGKLVPPKDQLAFRLLIGALADGILSEYLPDADLTPTLLEIVKESGAVLSPYAWSPAEMRRLVGALASGSSREAVIQLSEKVLRIDGRDLASQLGIKLSRRPPRVSPQWVAQFQSSDRPIQAWLDDGLGGMILFIVHNTARCSYNICHGCALPKLSADRAITPVKMFDQTDYVFGRLLTPDELAQLTVLVLSNNGSVFDQPTFPQVCLLYDIQRACQFMPRLQTISLETRAEFVTDDALDAVCITLKESGTRVKYEIALGVEIFDEHLRNKAAKKGLSNKAIERLAQQVGRTGGSLRCYFMLKPLPQMTDEAALADILSGLDFLEDITA